ncbi:MAG: Magnesium-transporting ATPase, P-type 1 [Thermoproteota archaeon]|nr:Magnesium-transporting ATPase, P-type 1 [Thermoproteota archaeon]
MSYWSKSAEEVFREFSSFKDGLSDKEVDTRLKQYGFNDIPKRREKTVLNLLISQLKDLLIIALIVASIVSFFTGGEIEGITILSIVIVNVIVGFAQEYKSEKSLQKLAVLIKYRVKVFRDNRLLEVDTRNIVPGDLILLETGDRIPADLRLIEIDELEIDESIVTGESYPVPKSSDPIMAEKLEPQKMENMAFPGTLVVNGKGKGIVVSTGMKSTLGQVAGMLKLTEPVTNYEKGIKSFSKFLIKGILVGVTFIFIMNALTGKTFFDSALFSLALAVGIIPESLPIIITIGLSRGAMLMSRSGVIVKKLNVIEDLGNMDIICSDKTGTITENKITLTDYIDLDGNKDAELLKLVCHCVSIVEDGEKATGNPIDVAIFNYCKKQPLLASTCDLAELIPFDYSRRRMSIIVRQEGKCLLICKGAPESMLQICSTMKVRDEITELDKDKVNRLYEDLSRKGIRAIGLGLKEVDEQGDYSKADEHDLTFIGMLCFFDPLKQTAKQSIDELKELGVEVKILTGDSPLVAKTIAEEAGMSVEMLTGKEINDLNDETLQKTAEKTNVFARLTPEQKTRIVQTLRKNGHVIGFLGDGVNDAPALKVADVGISVDGAVDIAKEAADIVLTESSLEIIRKGIIEGRTTFGNTTKYILNTVSANLGNMASLAVVSVVLNFLPMLPFQVLLINLISDGPLLSISTDRVDEEELRKPRNWNIKLISKFTTFFGGISSIFDFTTMAFLFAVMGGNVALFRTGWFVESTLSEIIVTFAIRTRKRFYQSKPSKILLGMSIICGFLTVLLPYSPLNTFFEFSPPDIPILLAIFGILAMYFSAVELIKHFFHKKYS